MHRRPTIPSAPSSLTRPRWPFRMPAWTLSRARSRRSAPSMPRWTSSTLRAWCAAPARERAWATSSLAISANARPSCRWRAALRTKISSMWTAAWTRSVMWRPLRRSCSWRTWKAWRSVWSVCARPPRAARRPKRRLRSWRNCSRISMPANPPLPFPCRNPTTPFSPPGGRWPAHGQARHLLRQCG